MKTLHNIHHIIILILFYQTALAQVHFGHLIINDQAALDTFNFEEVTGVLIIEATDTISNKITDLSPLGSLKIAHSNLGLTNIHATDYSALNNLEIVGKGLFFDNCRFSDLTFLTSLTSVEGFSARNMHDLTSLDGLQFMTTCEYLYLWNLGIADFQGLNNLQEVGRFLFRPNAVSGILQSCNGLQSLIKADQLDIRAAVPFTSLGLENVDTVNVMYFHKLSDFTYMNVRSVDYIYCHQCEMSDFSGLENVGRLGNYDSTNSAGLWIQYGYNLASTIGLENLEEAKFININQCPLLQELNFTNLDSTGTFSLSNCPILESTSKMQSLIYVDSRLTIGNNPSLIDCCAFEDVLSLPGLNIYIGNNPFPCNNETTISNECSGMFTWTGGTGTDLWNTAGNWEGNIVPDETNSTTVIIPSNPVGNVYPSINTKNRTINKLVIGKSGEMIIDGKALHISSPDIDIIGTVLGKLEVKNGGELRVGNINEQN